MRNLGKAIRSAANKRLIVTFKTARRAKTVAQNSYYHMLIGLICYETGENKRRLRLIMKDKLGYYTEVWHDGNILKDYKSMADVTIEKSSEFIEAAQELCEHLGIRYPTTDYWYDKINYRQ